MSTISETRVATAVYQVYVKATPEAVWDALTNPARNDKYGYQSRSEYELHEGGAYRGFANDAMRAYGSPEVVIDGEVVEAEAPRRLVQTWHALFTPETVAEPPTRLTFELEDAGPGLTGVTRLTVTHELDEAPATAAYVTGALPETGGGWPFVLSDLKSLLETGESMGQSFDTC